MPAKRCKRLFDRLSYHWDTLVSHHQGKISLTLAHVSLHNLTLEIIRAAKGEWRLSQTQDWKRTNFSAPKLPLPNQAAFTNSQSD